MLCVLLCDCGWGGASWNCVRAPSFTRFALCEASKYIFYLRYEAGAIYKKSSREFELILQEVSEPEKRRLAAIWSYWEQNDSREEEEVQVEEGLHPDHAV